jgi:hypothetical protein
MKGGVKMGGWMRWAANDTESSRFGSPPWTPAAAPVRTR